MAADDAETQATLAGGRLTVLNAIVAAQQRHVEVAAALWSASDRRTAMTAVVELLGIEPWAAPAVVDLPWWRLGAGSRRKAEEDRDETARHIAHLGNPALQDPEPP